MDHLSDQSCQPGRKLRRGGHQFNLCRLRKLGSQDLQGLGSLIWPKPCQSADNLAGCLAPKGQLPTRRMTQFDCLPVKAQHVNGGVKLGHGAAQNWATLGLRETRLMGGGQSAALSI